MNKNWFYLGGDVLLTTRFRDYGTGMVCDLRRDSRSHVFTIEERPQESRDRMDRRAVARAVQMLYMLRKQATLPSPQPPSDAPPATQAARKPSESS